MNVAPVVVGVDVGGTKVLAGVVDEAGHVLRPVSRATPGRTCSVSALEDVLTAAVGAASDGAPVAAVGLAAAGFVDSAGERVAFAPHLPWRDDRVRERLHRRWGVPVVLENDATCACLAEHRFGAARGADSALLVTVGTGIGGGLVIGGRTVRGAGGMAGEYGHMTVVLDGLPCECGRRGCWEQYVSGRALLRAAYGGDPAQTEGVHVTEAARQGGAAALQAFAEVGTWLGRGLANLVAAIDPERIVVGGGVSAAGDLLLDPARLALAEHVVGAGHRRVPPVVRAELGAAAGLVGAAALAHDL